MNQPLTFKPINLARWAIWSLYALALLIAPLLFSQGASLSLLSQMGTLMIFGLSYNMLLGQGGMLSFGHAVYAGLGAFFAAHALNALGALGADGWHVPVSLIPLVGGLAGMAFALLFGYVSTRKSGTTFSMITLGLGELVFACSLMFPGFFGGEAGVATNRVVGAPVLGISFGPQIEVYYLIAAWLFVCTAAMYAFTRTPLGRILNAVRDNPERAAFIGYDTQWVRYLCLVLSGFFAGVSGGLSAINFEIVTAESVGAARSGLVLLFVFIGGTGYFFGPLIGAVAGVFMTVMLSDISKAWQLYLGLFFMLVVLYAPGGLAAIVMQGWHVLRLWRLGLVRRLWPALWRVALALAGVAAAAIVLVEMLYQRNLDMAQDSRIRCFGLDIDTAQSGAWWLAAAALLLAGLALRRYRPAFSELWAELSQEIEENLQRGRA